MISLLVRSFDVGSVENVISAHARELRSRQSEIAISIFRTQTIPLKTLFCMRLRRASPIGKTFGKYHGLQKTKRQEASDYPGPIALGPIREHPFRLIVKRLQLLYLFSGLSGIPRWRFGGVLVRSFKQELIFLNFYIFYFNFVDIFLDLFCPVRKGTLYPCATRRPGLTELAIEGRICILLGFQTLLV